MASGATYREDVYALLPGLMFLDRKDREGVEVEDDESDEEDDEEDVEEDEDDEDGFMEGDDDEEEEDEDDEEEEVEEPYEEEGGPEGDSQEEDEEEEEEEDDDDEVRSSARARGSCAHDSRTCGRPSGLLAAPPRAWQRADLCVPRKGRRGGAWHCWLPRRL